MSTHKRPYWYLSGAFWFGSITGCRRATADLAGCCCKRRLQSPSQYHLRVLGEFPLSDNNDAVVPMLLIESTMAHDAARSGSDRSALTKRRGPAVFEIRTWAGLDLMQLTAALGAEFNSTQIHMRPLDILVDSIGLGLGVVERLRELKLPERRINASESPSMKGRRSTCGPSRGFP